MNLKEAKIFPNQQAINPELIIRVRIEFNSFLEVPTLFSGILESADGKKLANLFLFDNDRVSFELWVQEREKVIQNLKNSHYGAYQEITLNFNAPLNAKAVEYIEEQRQKDSSKNIMFNIKIDTFFQVINNLKMGLQQGIADFGIKYECKQSQKSVNIEQSQWLREFSEPLGIGKYLIIELPLLNLQNQSLNHLWYEKIQRATNYLKQMELEFKSGEWQKVIETSRKIADIFKFNKDNQQDRGIFTDLLISSNYSEGGLNDLLQSIFHIHQFASKFMHDTPRDQSQPLHPIPTPKKEDAYLIYLFSIGLVSMISKKVNEYTNR